MALSIKNEETVRLARQLSEVTGESITTTIRIALEERLARVEPPAEKKARAEALMDIVRRVQMLPNADPRSADEILGYNEHGVWD